MSSNYPPGVTGNEYQIAGPQAVRTTERECGIEGIMLRDMPQHTFQLVREAMSDIAPLTQRWEQAVEANLIDAAPSREALRLIAVEVYGKLSRALQGIPEGAEVERCPFKGEVEEEGFDGIWTWECPVCGAIHEEDDDEEDDY